MQIFSITVTIKDNKIVINTNNLTVRIRDMWEDMDYSENIHKPIINHMLDDFSYSNPKVAEGLVNRQTSETKNISVKHEDGVFNSTYSNVYYTIPADQMVAFDLLSALYEFLKSRQFDHIMIMKPRDNYYLPSHTSDHLKLGDVTTDPDAAMRLLTAEILALPPFSPEYTATLSAINSAVNYSNQHPEINFGACFGIRVRYNIMFADAQIPLALTPDTTPAERTNYLYILARRLLAQNKKEELTHYVNSISKKAKENLFEICLGKDAADGGKYHWKYTEWPVIRDAEFYIRSDDRMGIILKDNAGYKKDYAPGCRNHKVMQAEFEAIAAINGLEFDKDTNFHEELIFTPESTRKLIAANVHINARYLKNLLLTKDTFSLFRHAKKSGTFFQGPRDVYDVIDSFAHPERHALIKGDLKTARDIGWNATYAKLK